MTNLNLICGHPKPSWARHALKATKRTVKTVARSIQQGLTGLGTNFATFGVIASASASTPFTTASSWQYPPLPLNYEALTHLVECFFNHRKCIDITELASGSYYEIREVHFEDGWSCVARFTRDGEEPVSVMDSETATVRYVRERTDVAVPEIYYAITNGNDVVGASFVLMEKLEGENLCLLWDELILEHKINVAEQTATVVVELMRLEFDKMGSLKSNGELGPLQSIGYSTDEQGRGPFNNLSEWVASILHPYEIREVEITEQYPAVAAIMMKLLEQHGSNPILKALFHKLSKPAPVPYLYIFRRWFSPSRNCMKSTSVSSQR